MSFINCEIKSIYCLFSSKTFSKISDEHCFLMIFLLFQYLIYFFNSTRYYIFTSQIRLTYTYNFFTKKLKPSSFCKKKISFSRHPFTNRQNLIKIKPQSTINNKIQTEPFNSQSKSIIMKFLTQLASSHTSFISFILS